MKNCPLVILTRLMMLLKIKFPLFLCHNCMTGSDWAKNCKNVVLRNYNLKNWNSYSIASYLCKI